MRARLSNVGWRRGSKPRPWTGRRGSASSVRIRALKLLVPCVIAGAEHALIATAMHTLLCPLMQHMCNSLYVMCGDDNELR